MRKMILFLCILAIAMPVYAQKDVSIGAFGGLNAPIVQDDAGSGSAFGARIKYSPLPLVGVAAFFEARSFDDPSVEIGNISVTTDGGKVTSIGIEGLIGSTGGGIGPHFYWVVGLGSYKWTRDNREDFSKVGFHLGPGIEIILQSNIGLEARAKIEIIPTGNEATRKNAIITVGANYHFALM
jgi:hypothetical protein